jgi:hypothetical protein
MPTPKEIEDFKQGKNFDRGLVEVLIPVRHAFRNDAEFLSQVELNITRGINPELVQFIIEGCREVPHRIKSKRQTKVDNIFAPRPQLGVYLRGFLEVYYRETGVAIDRIELRRATRQAHVLIVELIRRSQLAYLFDF